MQGIHEAPIRCEDIDMHGAHRQFGCMTLLEELLSSAFSSAARPFEDSLSPYNLHEKL